jgi:hypothetical protein
MKAPRGLILISFLAMLILIAAGCVNNSTTTTLTAITSTTVPSTINGITLTDVTIGHYYYPELSEFTVSVTDDPNSTVAITSYPFPSPFKGTYVNQQFVTDMRASIEKTAYIFKTDSNANAYLLITKGIADSISLVLGETYQITYDILRGWPFGYQLIITKADELVFSGISTGKSSNPSLNGLIPITVTQSKVLTDNYVFGSDDSFWLKKTNTEITFTLNENSIALHQGQSATLGEYNITLLIARKIDYEPNVYDAGQNSLSYIIAKNRD